MTTIAHRLSAHEKLSDVASAYGVSTTAIVAQNPHKTSVLMPGVGVIFVELEEGETIRVPVPPGVGDGFSPPVLDQLAAGQNPVGPVPDYTSLGGWQGGWVPGTIPYAIAWAPAKMGYNHANAWSVLPPFYFCVYKVPVKTPGTQFPFDSPAGQIGIQTCLANPDCYWIALNGDGHEWGTIGIVQFGGPGSRIVKVIVPEVQPGLPLQFYLDCPAGQTWSLQSKKCVPVPYQGGGKKCVPPLVWDSITSQCVKHQTHGFPGANTSFGSR